MNPVAIFFFAELFAGFVVIVLGSIWLADRIHKRVWVLQMPTNPTEDTDEDARVKARIAELREQRAAFEKQAFDHNTSNHELLARTAIEHAAECSEEIERLQERGRP